MSKWNTWQSNKTTQTQMQTSTISKRRTRMCRVDGVHEKHPLNHTHSPCALHNYDICRIFFSCLTLLNYISHLIYWLRAEHVNNVLKIILSVDFFLFVRFYSSLFQNFCCATVVKHVSGCHTHYYRRRRRRRHRHHNRTQRNANDMEMCARAYDVLPP